MEKIGSLLGGGAAAGAADGAGAAAGGADPVTAVANAIGKYLDVVGTAIDTYSNRASRNAALNRLNQAGVPKFHDWFAAYRVDKTQQNMNVIYVLAAVLVIVVIAFAIAGKGEKTT